jgi:hypothetical protein
MPWRRALENGGGTTVGGGEGAVTHGGIEEILHIVK